MTKPLSKTFCLCFIL